MNGDGYADVVVGASTFGNGEAAEGAAFAWFGSAQGLNRGGARPSGTPTNADWRAESNQAAAEYGAAVATAGDVNGDGFADLVVGAPRYDDPETDEGRAYVYLGSSAGRRRRRGGRWMGRRGSMLLGWSVAGRGT